MSIIQENPATGNPAAVRGVRKARIAAYVELTKLRISVMVLVTFLITVILTAATTVTLPGAATGIPVSVLLCAMIGMLAIAASGNAMNMYVERYSDFLMDRTRTRPLPDQRLSGSEVAMFGAISFGIGVGFLITAVNWQTAAVGIANWILYVLIYTPLKRKTHLNTEIGAIAGAMPVIMGCLATGKPVGVVGWSLFGVLVLWQFPHFMAIAWKYRHDYAAGGLKMLTVTEPTGRAAGRKAIVTTVLLIAVSLIPLVIMRTGVHAWSFGMIAIALGAWYLWHSIRFARILNDVVARKLLRVSLVYLPAYMLVLTVTCLT